MIRQFRPVTARALVTAVVLLAMSLPAWAQTVTVTTAEDVVDINPTTGTIGDLPGPDGKVSFSEAMIATNNTPGHQTVGFAIPESEWILQFLYPGRAVLSSITGFYWRAFDEVTIDGTTQTDFTGDTNPDGNEVVFYRDEVYLVADNCTLIGIDSSNVVLSSGTNGLIDGNTGSMNIDVFSGSGNTISNNEGGTIKLDRTSDNVVVGNTITRVRVWGGGPDAANNRIGGPNPEDRNFITGYGTHNSEGLPSGTTVQLFRTTGTIVENNWIGTADGLTQGSEASTVGIGLETENSNVIIRDNLISGILGRGMPPHHGGQLFGRGILASGSGSGLNVTGNIIGPDITGEPSLGSVWGLDLGDPVTHPLTMTDITIENNEIAGHILNGVTVGRQTPSVRFTGNSIHDNGWLGIDLIPTGYGYGVTPNDPLDTDTGGNGLQNFPVLATVTRDVGGIRVTGSLHSSPGDDFTIELYASPECDSSGHGEGELPLGTTVVTTDAQGDAVFDVTVTGGPVPAGWAITATATLEPLGATSEFSACVVLDEPPAVEILLTPESIEVPAGGFLVFDAQVTNNSASNQTFDTWIDAIKPNGVPYSGNPVIGPKNATLGPGQSITKTVRLRIPARIAPSGPYTMIGKVGTHPSVVIDSSSFEFTVIE